MQSVVLFAIFSRWWSFCAFLKCAHRRVLTIKRNSSLLILYVQVKRGFKNKNWGLKLDVFIKLLSSSLALDWWWIIFKNCSLCSSSRKKLKKFNYDPLLREEQRYTRWIIQLPLFQLNCNPSCPQGPLSLSLSWTRNTAGFIYSKLVT